VPVLLRLMLRWFPDRSFRFAGDAGYGSHEMAELAAQSRGRLHLVSKFHPKANLYQAPPEVVGKRPNGRPRKKGAKLPSPQQVVAQGRAPGTTWPGTGAAGATSRWSAAPGTGTREALVWLRCARCTCIT
jgi:hypothetical protein